MENLQEDIRKAHKLFLPIDLFVYEVKLVMLALPMETEWESLYCDKGHKIITDERIFVSYSLSEQLNYVISYVFTILGSLVFRA